MSGISIRGFDFRPDPRDLDPGAFAWQPGVDLDRPLGVDTSEPAFPADRDDVERLRRAIRVKITPTGHAERRGSRGVLLLCRDGFSLSCSMCGVLPSRTSGLPMFLETAHREACHHLRREHRGFTA